jgi:hypothetical protein
METNQLSMRWLPVTDTSGRTHMEAVWIYEETAAAVSVTGRNAA